MTGTNANRMSANTQSLRKASAVPKIMVNGMAERALKRVLMTSPTRSTSSMERVINAPVPIFLKVSAGMEFTFAKISVRRSLQKRAVAPCPILYANTIKITSATVTAAMTAHVL